MDRERCASVYEAARRYRDRIEVAFLSYRSRAAGFYRANVDSTVPSSLSEVEEPEVPAEDGIRQDSRDFVILMDDTAWLRDQISYAESEIGSRGDRISPFIHIQLSDGSVRASKIGARLKQHHVQYDRTLAAMKEVHRDLKGDSSFPYPDVPRDESVGGEGALEDDILGPLTREMDECIESLEA